MGPRDYSRATRAALFGLAGGTCYAPGCTEPIVKVVDGVPSTNSHIAHIHDAKPGNRYDPTMTDDQRRSFPNLLLLCQHHHHLVDVAKPEDYPAETLQEWKTFRESDHDDIHALDQLSEQEVSDALVASVINISGGSVQLGGQGGQAPGAGGGGGASIGGGAGGAGGRGGDRYLLDGAPGETPGAGGGGAGSDHPLLPPGNGGDGGEIVEGLINVSPGDRIEVTVGRGGEPGLDRQPAGDGGDTVVVVKDLSGAIKQTITARGGKGATPRGAQLDSAHGPALAISSLMLADLARIENDLLVVVGGAFGNYDLQEVPGQLNTFVVIVGTSISTESRETNLGLELRNPEGGLVHQLGLPLVVPAAPETIKVVVPIVGLEISRVGRWSVELTSGGQTLAKIAINMALASG